MKKMRRLIPAIAMLLVSAVMLSTASFAWFTMNETATATGMQVQAKASGNLLINTQGLTAADNKIEVTVSNPEKVNLTPITYVKKTTENNLGDAEQWQYATDATKIDPLYGDIVSGTLAKFDAENNDKGTYFAEYEVYLATAGDALTNCDVSVQIHGLSGVEQAIAPAYTIAFWVIGQNGGSYADPDYNNPTHILNYRDGQAAKVKITEESERVTVPSTIGAGADSRVGVKVIMRVYVDGALPTGQTKVEQTKDLVAITTATATTWGDLKDTHATSEIYINGGLVTDDERNTWTDDKDMTGYTYWDGTYTDVNHVECYVNNANVPTGATTFEVDFSVVSNPTT